MVSANSRALRRVTRRSQAASILVLIAMKLLLIGLSSIARRRILPAAMQCGFETIEVASRTASQNGWNTSGVARIYSDYSIALDETPADLVYISTVNSTHAELAEAALTRGFHVIVDKPAFLSLAETERLAALALRQQRLLAEATVWSYHPRIGAARRVFADAGSEPTQIVSTFSFPPMPRHDFRYRRELGGGAVWDLGPYALTPGRVFFGDGTPALAARVTQFLGDVETSFSLLGVFSNGRSLVGSFGYNTGYINRLEVAGPGMSVWMDRVFSPPADFPSELVVRNAAGTTVVPVSPADNFKLMLMGALEDIAGGRFREPAGQMLADAKAMAALRQAVETGNGPA